MSGYTISVDLVRERFDAMPCQHFSGPDLAARAFVRICRAMENDSVVMMHASGEQYSIKPQSFMFRGRDVVLVTCRPPLTDQDITNAQEWLDA